MRINQTEVTVATDLFSLFVNSLQKLGKVSPEVAQFANTVIATVGGFVVTHVAEPAPNIVEPQPLASASAEVSTETPA